MSQSLINPETGSVAIGSLEERLSAHPQLKQRREARLNVVENSTSEVEKAEIAEQQVMEQVRQIGQAALVSWAESQHHQQSEKLCSDDPLMRQHLKKNSTGIPALEP